ncbi:MAG: family 20 glycosylhydrolase [Candidatus Ratteibacteria bacterium]|jgi:hypothetical protein
MKHQKFICYMHDIGRGGYLKPEIFKEAIRYAAASGFTHYMPYLENMIRLSPIEKACPPCAYTRENWREFDDVAEEAGIELIPHFNVIGHTAAIRAAHPELAGTKNKKGTPCPVRGFDPTTPAAQKIILACLEEYCSFSRSEYFLIGGDEWMPPHQLLAQKGFDVGLAWVRQINRAVDFLSKVGRVPIVWHDMLTHYPGTLEKLSKQAAIAFWKYDANSDYPVLSFFKRRGFKVFMASGILGGPFTNRRVKALKCALRAVKKHSADGLIMTSWENGRWECERLNFKLVAQVINGKKPDKAITDAVSLYAILLKITPESQFAEEIRKRIHKLLRAKSWQKYPDYLEFISARIAGDSRRDLALYLKYQSPFGPIYEQIKKELNDNGSASPLPPAKKTQKPAKVKTGFGITDEGNRETGPALRIINDDETFVVYPKFGAVIQDWHVDDVEIISHGLPDFIRENPHALPGGSHSYGTFGFRPIWALGEHQNPCIIWQYPWQHQIVESSDKRIVVEVSLSLEHVSITGRITVEKGTPGFQYDVSAENKLSDAFCAFNWHLLLSIAPENLPRTILAWEKTGKRKSITIGKQTDDGFWIDARKKLTVTTRPWKLKIETNRRQTAGFFLDWASSFFTPDIHGVYRRMKPGGKLSTTWKFHPEKNRPPKK